MGKIQLLTRQIDSAEMGFCSVHEHIAPQIYRAEEHDAIVAHSLNVLKKAYDLGVRTVMDVSPWPCVRVIKDILPHTPMQLAGCTGFYVDRENLRAAWTADDFYAAMMHDIEYGLENTDLQPGVIKVASANEQLKPQEEQLMIAAGRVQKKTGLPICVHSVAGCLHQFRHLTEGGADPAKLYFCHVESNLCWGNRTFDEQIGIFTQLTEAGSFLCFNNFGNWQHTPEKCMADIILTMDRLGYGGQMLATLDYFWQIENGKLRVGWEEICEDGQIRDCAYLITHVQPWMRRQGINENLIQAMNLANPARLFG